MHKRLVILGSGPAGLTAAIYAARAGLALLVLHGSQAGGQLTTTTMVENFPGFKGGILGPALMDEMQAQALRFGAEFLSADAESCDLSQRPFVIKAGGETITTDALIIACGASPKLLGLPAESKLMGRGVSVCATCDGFFFKGKKLFVVGGGDAALEEAITLTNFASSVTVIHRRDQLRASKIMVDRAFDVAKNTGKLNFIFDSVVEGISGEATGAVDGITVKNVKTGEVQNLPADGLFIAIGHNPNTSLFRDQLQVNERGYLVTNGVRTSIDGVFAAGDVHDERYRQAVVAAGEGCMAALEAQWFLKQHAPAASTTESDTRSQPQAVHATVAVNHTNFEQVVINSAVPVIIDFWAEWCSPCRAIAPKIEALAAEYKGRLVIAKWNVDETEGVWERFHVRGIPTLIVYQDGQEVKRLSGQEPLQFLKNEFDDLIGEQDADSDAAKALRAELDATMKAAMEKLQQDQQQCWQDLHNKLPPELVRAEEEAERSLEEEVDKRLADLKARYEKGEVSEDDYSMARFRCLKEIEEDPAFADMAKTRDEASEKVREAIKPLIPEYQAASARCEDLYNEQVATARARFREALAQLKTQPTAPAPASASPAAAQDVRNNNPFAVIVAWLRAAKDKIFGSNKP